jgi:ADP-dependent NAD(P)H-hydrate dehydratase / NAD(P)H-hydrate epimerase
MEIFSAEQIRLWDQFTVAREPISSIDLMDRAAGCCERWLESQGFIDRSFSIFCAKGNNGGDGLALARMLAEKECSVLVYILEFGHLGTNDFQINLARLHLAGVEIRFIQTEETFRPIPENDIVIDALFGSGLNRPLEGVTAKLIEHINLSGNTVVSIDLPSGLYVDKSSKGNTVIKASHTLSFQCFKLAFLLPENEGSVGDLHILDIGLHPDYLLEIDPEMNLTDMEFIRTILKPRNPFAHKGIFGHALLIAGSLGKMGAAVLASKACLRSGAGLLTCHIPGSGQQILQTALPEAMLSIDVNDQIQTAIREDLSVYSVLGIGPGIGTDQKTKQLLEDILKKSKKPLVLDADALNILSKHPELLPLLPPYSVLTPHPKEFERLFGKVANDFDNLQLALTKAKELRSIIVLKGHFTFIAVPEGRGYFNSTGNAGMAKGGSGDALTGVITGLLSQGYTPSEASILGVFLHGLAGDIAADLFSEQAMLPSDLIDCIGKAFQQISKQ